MGGLNYSYRDIETVETKLQSVLVLRPRGRERSGYVVFDGRKLWRVTFPRRHEGGQSPSPGFIRALIDDLHVDKDFFKDLVDCPKDLRDYRVHIREKLT